MNKPEAPTSAALRQTELKAAKEDLFEREILHGLKSDPKSLPSKYLYDTRGDQIFQQIMELPEYYLTRCEEEILRNNKGDLLQRIQSRAGRFDIVELGAGDGKKTRLLLSHFLDEDADFRYLPVDISQHAVEELCDALAEEYPKLVVKGLVQEYMMALNDLAEAGGPPRLVLFMGGNIGNFSKPEAREFMAVIASRLSKNDLVLTGFDLKKDPVVIHNAYNDSKGVTREFNFNLLRRINRQLNADFDPASFIHYPTYEPLTGAMKSYLVSTKEQTVRLQKTGTDIHFDAWEPIFMEVSNKYTMDEVRTIASYAGLNIAETYADNKGYYINVLFSKS